MLTAPPQLAGRTLLSGCSIFFQAFPLRWRQVGHAGIDHSFMSMRPHCSAAKGRHLYLGMGADMGSKDGNVCGWAYEQGTPASPLSIFVTAPLGKAF